MLSTHKQLIVVVFHAVILKSLLRNKHFHILSENILFLAKGKKKEVTKNTFNSHSILTY